MSNSTVTYLVGVTIEGHVGNTRAVLVGALAELNKYENIVDVEILDTDDDFVNIGLLEDDYVDFFDGLVEEDIDIEEK